jgi:peptidoglycan/xylan/chitin deacetylase (PgdA/CDA1 family)/glycosyltransferase involved in cell wall biosynthesis
MSGPRVTVVVPTHDRREVVVRTVRALERQLVRDFDVIVVDDGSTDGTAAALRGLHTPFPLTVIEQKNLGAAAARNAGAALAQADILLFLDDDMEADARLLAEHERSLADGADIVLGHVPLHPDSPPNLLSSGVGRWAERRRARLSAAGEVPGLEMLTGQMSISRESFEALGGFDTGFTRDGMFGGEDRDFGYRAAEAGLRIVFNEAAVSHQYFVVDPAAYTRRTREAGRAAAELQAKHPRARHDFSAGRTFTTRRSRILFGLLGRAPEGTSRPLRIFAERRIRLGRYDGATYRLFFGIQTMEYQRGLREATRRLRRGRGVVLAYHAIADLSEDPVLAEYGVPPVRFAEHLDMLLRTRYRFISLTDVLRALEGEQALPRRAVLLTFDDAYADFLTAAWPILAERGIPAVTFVVAGRIGQTNEWDRALGAKPLALLTDEGLRAVARQGVEIGSHGMTHRRLPALDGVELDEEVRASALRVASLGLPRPRAFSYPHGQYDERVLDAVHDAGYDAAFTADPGVLRPVDRYTLPRIEVSAQDTPRALRIKVASARWPRGWQRGLLWLLRG